MRLPLSAFSALSSGEPLIDPFDRSRRFFPAPSLAGSDRAQSACASHAVRPRLLFRRSARRVPGGALISPANGAEAPCDLEGSPSLSVSLVAAPQAALRLRSRAHSGRSSRPAANSGAAFPSGLPVRFVALCEQNALQRTAARRASVDTLRTTTVRRSDELPRASAHRKRRTLLLGASGSAPSASASGGR
jgi:hypothetical protein